MSVPNPAALIAALALKPQDRANEFLSGGSDSYLSPYYKKALRVLSHGVDDLQIDFGDEVYEEMLTDEYIASSAETLKVFVVSDTARVIAAIKDKDKPGYKEAQEIADFVDRELKNMGTGMHEVLYSLMDFVFYGSALAEVVYTEPKADLTLGRIVQGIKSIKVKSRKKYAFVVDNFMNVLGVVNRETGPTMYGPAATVDPKTVVPREKLLILTYNGRNGDPRGRSILRALWNVYSLKTQTLPQWLKYLVQFASPSIVGTTPEKAPDTVRVKDENGQEVPDPVTGLPLETTPEAILLDALLQFQGGTAAALKGGSKLDILWSQGEGQAFVTALDYINRCIVLTILKSARTTMEAKNNSKADTEGAQDITALFVDFLREILSAAFRKDVITQLVLMNFGPEAAERWVPEFAIGGAEKQDFAKVADAIAKLWVAGLLHVSQVEGLWQMMELPKGDFAAFLAEHQEKADEAARLRDERQKLIDPRPGNEDDPAVVPPAKAPAKKAA